VSLRGVRVAQIPETGGVDMFIEQNDDYCARRRGLSRYDEETVMSFGDFSVPGLFFSLCLPGSRMPGPLGRHWRIEVAYCDSIYQCTSE
jgi:hypothetical protein